MSGAKLQLWLGVVAVLLCSAANAFAQGNDEQLYKAAIAREATLRTQIDTRKAGSAALPLLRSARVLIGTYEDMARLFPRSAYSDNALWQGGMLAADVFWEFGEAADRTRALSLLNALVSRYPTSSLIKQAAPQTARLAAAAGAPPPSPRPATATTAGGSPPTAAAVTASATVSATVSATTAADPVTLTSIRREVLPEALRVTLELEREVPFYDERIDGPPRVFVDLQNTVSVDALKDATLAYPDDVVRQIRVGRQLGVRTRVVLDLEGAGRHSVYALYNPFRIVIDVERPGATKTTTTLVAAKDTKPTSATKDTKSVPTTKDTKVTKESDIPTRSVAATTTPPAPIAAADISAVAPAAAPVPAPRAAVAAPEAPSPVAAQPNADGTLSLSRQLGLGVARVVIDPGHGGHDPGAKVKGLTEADLVLDVALRLEKLLVKQGVEVVMTRRTDTFIPLEERTAIANRQQADLFLSIHANASEDARARGVETYFLNFAPNKQAEAIAARENASAARTMRALPDIVKAIALNNKIDESRDFATTVQASMLERLKKANKTSRNLGVKQAPFMVLIGATMPSVLAEVSFVTNKQEQGWLKTKTYRQQLAEALFDGIMDYQRSLKATPQIAATK